MWWNNLILGTVFKDTSKRGWLSLEVLKHYGKNGNLGLFSLTTVDNHYISQSAKYADCRIFTKRSLENVNKKIVKWFFFQSRVLEFTLVFHCSLKYYHLQLTQKLEYTVPCFCFGYMSVIFMNFFQPQKHVTLGSQKNRNHHNVLLFLDHFIILLGFSRPFLQDWCSDLRGK